MPTPARPQLWHGGAPGREEGEWLFPPDETGIPVTSRDLSVDAGLDQIAHRRDRVYLTTDRGLAKAWAGIWTPDGERHGGGTLYRVEADLLEPDEDLLSLPGVSFQAPRARVVRVYDPYVAYPPRHLNVLKRILTQHARAKQADQRPW